MKNICKFLFVIVIVAFASCDNKKTEPAPQNVEDSIDIADPDSTLYGICGEGTSMHMLELVTDDHGTVNLMVDIDDEEMETVKGGLIAGDRLAVIIGVVNGDTIARNVINLTTLEGKWTSLDRNFEIVQGGEVLSTLQSESNPYTSWKIHNGQLLLGRDSFDILTLGADSLEVENSKGIFVYTRK